MRWASFLLSAGLAAQAQPEFSRPEPPTGLVMGYRDGRILVGGGNGGAALLKVEDREGRALKEVRLGAEGAGRFRVTTAAMTAGGEVVAGAVAMELPGRMENRVVFGDGAKVVGTGGFSCMVVAAAGGGPAWCLGFWMEKRGEAGGPAHLLYRVGADGRVAGFYELPGKAEGRTAEGLTRFPALGLPGLWANADGSVWAWLPRDGKVARFREQTGRLEAWDVPVPKGGPAGVSVAVSSGGRVVALLPVSQDGWRVAPGPSPVFGLYELNPGTGQWSAVEGLQRFRRGVKLAGVDAGWVVVVDGERRQLQWYGLR